MTTFAKHIVDRLLQPDGTYPERTDIGGYPLVYVTPEGDELCAPCATEERNKGEEIAGVFVHWEEDTDGPMHSFDSPVTHRVYCVDCSKYIAPAYTAGDPAIKQAQTALQAQFGQGPGTGPGGQN